MIGGVEEWPAADEDEPPSFSSTPKVPKMPRIKITISENDVIGPLDGVVDRQAAGERRGIYLMTDAYAFCSRNSSSPATPASRPRPDCL